MTRPLMDFDIFTRERKVNKSKWENVIRMGLYPHHHWELVKH